MANDDELTCAVEYARIKRVSTVFNTSNDITGCLVTFPDLQGDSRDRVVQRLEGDKEEVLALYEKIKNDLAATNYEVLWQGFTPKRRFPNWTMLCLFNPDRVKLIFALIAILSE